MDIDVSATFFSTKQFLNLRDPERGGQILNFSSMASKRANWNAALYCATKAAVTMLSQTTQIKAKDSNVSVKNVCPGAVDSPFWGDCRVPWESRVVIRDIEFESMNRVYQP